MLDLTNFNHRRGVVILTSQELRNILHYMMDIEVKAMTTQNIAEIRDDREYTIEAQKDIINSTKEIRKILR